MESGRAERATGPVNGYVATRSATGTKTDTPLLETPQSISVVTRDQMTAQSVQTVSEALRYTPGISLYNYGVNSVFDTITVRGFQAPLYLDGLRLPVDAATTFATSRVVPYSLERLEVLRGPSSVLYGQTPPGGLVNMVSKRPTDTPQNEVQFQTGSFGRTQEMVDFSGPLDASGQWLYRFVGANHNGGTQIDHQTDNQYFAAPSLTWRPSPDTSLTVLGSVQSYYGKGYQQYVPAVGSVLPDPNGRIPYSRYLGEPGNDYYRLNQQSIGYIFEHRFNDFLQFRQNARYTNIDINLLSLREEGMGADLRTVPRSELYVFGNTHNIAVDNQLQADFATGPLAHKLLLGIDYYDTASDSGFNFAPGTPIDAFAPVYGTPQVGLSSLFPVIHTKSDLQQLGFYLQDQIKWNRWVLSLSGRFDQASQTTFDKLASARAEQEDSATTGRAGLTYVFDNGIAPYVSYATSFQPTAGTDAQGAAFRPTTGQGSEVGIKYQPPGVKALFTAALFDVTQQNVLTPDPSNPLFSAQLGEIRVRGIEFEAKASLSDRLDVIAGWSTLDPRVTKSTAGTVGNVVPNVALQTASLWGVYTMHDGPFAGWGVGAGVRYVGKSYADDTNTLATPDYTLFDALLSYDFAYLRPDLKGLKLQVNATNLANHYYVPSCFGVTYCTLGAGRTVFVSLKYRWGETAKTDRIAKAW